MYKITVKFQDKNMPDIHSTAPTEQGAINEAARLQRTFASLRAIAIESPTHAKLIYNGAGVYLFTIPPM